MKARHNRLLETIGVVFDEEEYALWLVTDFSWILPIIILCGGLLDLLFIGFYMRFAHPWKEILYGEKMSEKDKEAKVNSQVHDDVMVYVVKNDDIEISVDSQDQNQGWNTSSQDEIRYEMT